MKRITYVSHLAAPLSEAELEEIGTTSCRNNQQAGITGALIYFGGLFFQIIEGDEARVTRLYDKIRHDPRHTNVLCLKTEHDVTERLFPDWSMETINLDKATDALVRPVRVLLNSLVESQVVIEKYTQPAVLKIINAGLNPLQVPPQQTDKIVFLSDMISFSLLSEKLPLETVMELVNRYLDIVSSALTRHGGEVTKFIGDSVLAYFDPAQADAAVQAGLDILARLAELRGAAPPDSALHYLYCGIGLAYGALVEGNFGSTVKLDYTIIGDPVNRAARLESLTRRVRKALVLSEDVACHFTRDWPLTSLGSFDVKGKNEPITAYTLNDPLMDHIISHAQLLEQLTRLTNRVPAA